MEHMNALRADAARSRESILVIARTRDPRDLRLNEIARDAGVGVGTVYRHFPTVHALVEALSLETLQRLDAHVREAIDQPDPARALGDFLRAALELQLADGGLQEVLISPDDQSEAVRELKHRVLSAFAMLLARAKEAGVVRADLTVAQLQHLVCGIEHAVRLGGSADQRPFVDILLAGIAPAPAGI